MHVVRRVQACRACGYRHTPYLQVVVHCWGGGGRTGQALAAWRVRHHGMAPEEAGRLVEAYAKAAGASRRVEQPLLAKFMGQPAPPEPAQAPEYAPQPEHVPA